MEMQAVSPIKIPEGITQNINKFDIKKTWPFVVGAFLVVLAGVATAILLSGKTVGGGGGNVAPGAVSTANEAGKLDPNFKYDNATGILKEGGTGGEGTHHLERDGGPSHFVYLTSSVIDLQSFIDKKVEIWGETQAGKKAGWLMDVAKVKVVQ